MKTTKYNVNGVTGTRYDCTSNEEWREERSHSIGASAIGTLVGANPFSTPMELAVKMRKELEGEFDYEQTLAMMRGHAYEQGVADLFSWKTGKEIIQSSSREYLLRRDDAMFMHASPDRTYWIDAAGMKHGKNAAANKGLLECKTTFRPIDPDNLPVSWQFQLQVQMGIGGFKEGFIAWDVLTSRDGFGYKFFQFDEDIFNTAVELCRWFWDNTIIGGNDPDPVDAADIVRKFPNSIEGKTITADEDTKHLIADLKEMQSTAKELDGEIDELKKQLILKFTDEEAIIDGESGKPLVTYKTKAGAMRVDSKKLKADYPDIYTAVAKQGESTRTLLIK